MIVNAFSGFDNWKSIPIGKLLYAYVGAYNPIKEEVEELISRNRWPALSDFDTTDIVYGDIWFPDGQLLYPAREPYNSLFAEWERGERNFEMPEEGENEQNKQDKQDIVPAPKKKESNMTFVYIIGAAILLYLLSKKSKKRGNS